MEQVSLILAPETQGPQTPLRARTPSPAVLHSLREHALPNILAPKHCLVFSVLYFSGHAFTVDNNLLFSDVKKPTKMPLLSVS